MGRLKCDYIITKKKPPYRCNHVPKKVPFLGILRNKMEAHMWRLRQLES